MSADDLDEGPQDGQPSRHFVQSLARGLAVLETFSDERPRMTLSQVAQATGLTRATARRLVLTLHDLGYLRSDGRTFEPTSRVLDLGYAYLSTHSVWETIRPIVSNLVRTTQESSSIAVLDAHEAVYVVRIPSKRIMSIGLTVGARLPLFATSTGRVLLAHLTENELDEYFGSVDRPKFTSRTLTDEQDLRRDLAKVHRRGWALVDQELETGVRSLAVPLHDRRGEALAALNVAAHASRVSADALRRRFLAPLQETAAEVETELARRGTSLA